MQLFVLPYRRLPVWSEPRRANQPIGLNSTAIGDIVIQVSPPVVVGSAVAQSAASFSSVIAFDVLIHSLLHGEA
jgi:hypothetical protein